MRKLLLDVPSRHPALGFPDTAAALARVIAHSDPRFAVGVFGGWGSGKTTLMEAIAQRLDAEANVPVEFSAWRYEKEEHLIVPLLDTVREALVEWAAARGETGKQARKTASTIGRVMRSIIAGTSMKIGVPGAIDISFDANKALTEHRAGVDADANTPGSFYHASFRALQGAFREFVGDEDDPDRRIVVFVDDLDRCLPESALQVLESMKLFFDLPGFVFVVGLDQQVVEHVIDAKYGRPVDEASNGGGESRISGAEYIKKIFQLPYRLAPVAIDQLHAFLEASYDEARLSDDQRDELRTIVAPHLRWLVGDAAVNPREIKRYVNAYTLLVEVDGESSLDANAVLTLQTIAFRVDWSQVQDALLEYQDAFADALRRQSNGEANALSDLDLDLQAIPDDFLEYVAPGAPGSALLTVGSLAPYLSSGEAVRSTQNPRLLDALRAAGSVRRILQQAAAVGGDIGNAVPEALKTLSRVEGSVQTAAGVGPLRDAVIADIDELKRGLELVARRAPDPDQTSANRGVIVERLEPLARSIGRRLLRMYRRGDVAGATAQVA